MKKYFNFSLLGSLLLILAGCSSSTDRFSELQERKEWFQSPRYKVLCTTQMIGNIAAQIGGDTMTVLNLIGGGLDPHTYELVKGDDEKFKAADLVLYNGLGLEHGPSLSQTLSHHPNAIGLGNVVKMNNLQDLIFVRGELDPHIWLDASLWSQICDPIVKAMAQLDPTHTIDYQRRGQECKESLMALHLQVKEMLQEVDPAKRFLVTSHDAFNYFTKAYLATDEERMNGEWRKRFAAPDGLAPESQLGAMDIRHIIEHMQRYHIHVLFPESNVSQDSIRKIVHAGQEKGLELEIAEHYLFADAMGRKGEEGDAYIGMLIYNAQLMKYYFNKTFDSRS